MRKIAMRRRQAGELGRRAAAEIDGAAMIPFEGRADLRLVHAHLASGTATTAVQDALMPRIAAGRTRAAGIVLDA